MTQFNARLVAYDCMGQVEWSVKVWDTDDWMVGSHPQSWEASGTLRGEGSDQPSKWLRGLLEQVREQM